ncbi:MAG: substrate-binding domain-containing protein, partial [Anaerolineae bacterium]|nr:substrate-binding domain-containing protein [Anaerolineae bacterium]
IILYHMVVGRPPFDTSSSDIISIIYQHLEKNPIAPSVANPDIPASVEAVIMRALAKDPNERYDSAKQMADELDIALGRRVGSTHGTPTPFPHIYGRKPKPNQRRTQLFIAGGAVLLAVMIAILFFVSQQNTVGPVERATIQVGEEDVAGNVVPSNRQIELAQQALGTGFIAYITCNQTSEYHATQTRELGDFARQYGLNFRVYDSDTDEYRQLTQIERARADGAKVLMICPLNAQLLEEPLKAAQEADIPLVLFGSDMPSYGGVLMVGDDYLMGYRPGEVAGQIVASELDGKAKVVILDYPDLDYLVTRANGLEAGLLAHAPEANIIGRYRGATREFGEESIRNLLEQGIDF